MNRNTRNKYAPDKVVEMLLPDYCVAQERQAALSYASKHGELPPETTLTDDERTAQQVKWQQELSDKIDQLLANPNFTKDKSNQEILATILDPSTTGRVLGAPLLGISEEDFNNRLDTAIKIRQEEMRKEKFLEAIENSVWQAAMLTTVAEWQERLIEYTNIYGEKIPAYLLTSRIEPTSPNQKIYKHLKGILMRVGLGTNFNIMSTEAMADLLTTDAKIPLPEAVFQERLRLANEAFLTREANREKQREEAEREQREGEKRRKRFFEEMDDARRRQNEKEGGQRNTKETDSDGSISPLDADNLRSIIQKIVDNDRQLEWLKNEPLEAIHAAIGYAKNEREKETGISDRRILVELRSKIELVDASDADKKTFGILFALARQDFNGKLPF